MKTDRALQEEGNKLECLQYYCVLVVKKNLHTKHLCSKTLLTSFFILHTHHQSLEGTLVIKQFTITYSKTATDMIKAERPGMKRKPK